MARFGRVLGTVGAAGVIAVGGLGPAGATTSRPTGSTAQSVRSAAATALAGLPARAVAMRVGGELSMSLSVRPAAVRTLRLQYRLGSRGRIVTGSPVRTTAAGVGRLRFVPPRAGAWRIRVVVAPGAGAKAALSTWRVVNATGRAGATAVTTPAALPATVPAGALLGLTASVKPSRPRAAELWVQAAGRAAYTLVATTSSTSKGSLSFRPRPGAVGLWRFKVYVRPSLTLRGAWSGVRAVVVSTPPDVHAPGPVTSLAANTDEGPTGLLLAWHNPSDVDLAEVIVRRAPGSVPPPTAADGEPIVLTSPLAQAAHDTGLTPGTAYSYSVFTKDAVGNVSGTPTTLAVTTMAAALSWQPALTAIPHHGSFSSVSCPTTTFCLGVDQNGHALSYDGIAWSVPHQVSTSHFPASVSCPSATFCVVVNWAREAFVYRVSGGVGTWSGPTSPIGSSTVSAVSCAPGTTFCMAVDFSGRATTSSDGVTWTAPAITNAVAATTVSCATSTFCAVADSTGGVATWNGSAWTPRTALGNTHSFSGVSCPSTALCVAVDTVGASSTYSGATWSAPATIDANHFFAGVSCASDTFCMAADSTRVLTFNGSTWSAPTTVYPNATLNAVSCATASACVVVDRSSFGWFFRWNGATWTTAVESAAVDVDNQTTRVSCGTTTFCAAIDEGGEVATFDGTSWSAPEPLSAPFGLKAVDCVSSTFCVVGDYTGRFWRYDGVSWGSPDLVDNGQLIRAIACPSTTFCVAISSGGNALAFDGSTWTVTHVATDLYSVTCPTSGSCRAIDSDFKVHEFDGSSWSGPITVADGLTSVTCTTPTWCVGTVAQVAPLFLSTVTFLNGTTWSSPQEVAPSFVVGAVSCATSTTCVAMSAGNQGAMYDGSGWVSLGAVPGVGFNAGVSCVTIRFCAVVDADGQFVRATR